MEIFGGFTIKHGKVVRLVVSFIKLGFLDAFIPDEEVGERVPCFLGGGDVPNECLVLLGERHVNEVQSGGIELLVDYLPRLQAVQVLGGWVKSLFYDSPKLYRHKINVRAHVILPIGKARSIKRWRWATRSEVWHLEASPGNITHQRRHSCGILLGGVTFPRGVLVTLTFIHPFRVFLGCISLV